MAKFGVDNVLLLERDRLTSGTTWHAAGLMNTFGSLVCSFKARNIVVIVNHISPILPMQSSTSTWMRQYTKHLYSEVLPAETGLETGWRDIGFIELACDDDRLHAFRRIAAYNRLLGVEVEEIAADRVQELFPMCHVDDVRAGFHVPGDGRANPTDATMALAKGARDRGVQILEQCPVEGVTTLSNGIGPPTVTGVRLVSGQVIAANKVVNCGGMWARQFAEACGVHHVANQAAEHYYLITEAIEGVDPNWPVIEDSSRCVYIRPEGNGLMLGLFEWEGASWRDDAIPQDFNFGEIQPDWDRMMPYVEAAMERVPAVQNAGIKAFFCGPESFTPDNAPMVGESPELRNYYIAAGLNSIGILTGGGIGNILARWIKDGMAPSAVDVTGINANRFQRYQTTRDYRRTRVGEALGNTYRVHYPDHQPKSCRNIRQSALHERLASAGAYFRNVSGWESPAWYAPPGHGAVVKQESFGRENWFPYWRAEHLNCRENVSIFDMSFMSKFLVQGRDAGAFLNRLSTANVNGDCGWITYTQWLNERGYMEADLTVTKMAEDCFLVVATDTMHQHVKDHMLRRIGPDHVCVTDVTSSYAQINLQGPQSRALLQELTSTNLDQFAFRQAAEIDLGMASVWCMRITYVGELGYELFVPVEQARHVYDRLWTTGHQYGLQHAGLRALGSLRLEKGYRDYGHDMDNTDTLLECGLGFTCDFDKSLPFIGQEHVLAQKASAKERGGLLKRMVAVKLVDPEPMLHHGEVLWRNGQRVCDIRAGSYGHSLGSAVGLAMLEDTTTPITKSCLDANWEVEIAETKFPCEVSLAPFYDPKSLNIKI